MTEFGKSFCRLFLLVAGILIVVFQAEPAFAVKVINVSNTKHNLSMSAPVIANFWSTDEDQVCVFCHTPHNASVAVPLWNQYTTTGTFTVYSSATLEYTPAGLPETSMSRLCLSCHEGTVAMNTLANPGSTGANPIMGGGGDQLKDIYSAGEGPYLSSDLTNMHPVGFDYTDSQTPADPDIYNFANPEGLGLKFVDGGLGEKFLECATCHDPHVDSTADPEYDYFLRIPNTSSAMCLACHDK